VSVTVDFPMGNGLGGATKFELAILSGMSYVYIVVGEPCNSHVLRLNIIYTVRIVKPNRSIRHARLDHAAATDLPRGRQHSRDTFFIVESCSIILTMISSTYNVLALISLLTANHGILTLVTTTYSECLSSLARLCFVDTATINL
jgi:hypothetical protein